MKKIFLFFTLLVFAFSAQAQCEAALEITANVNVVTATIVATGAVAPFYTIDWGDGSGADFSQSATHTYANPGTYVITWVYADMTPGGCSLTATQEVIITGGGCTLDFTPIAVGLAVSVNATSSQTSAPVYTLDWGDGSPVVNSNQGRYLHYLCIGI
jgi:PKD repeat protein